MLLGEIKWQPQSFGIDPPLPGGGGRGVLPHDIRINHAGTKVYGSYGVWEVDISNLKDPNSWKITDFRCEIAAQVPGPWQEIHKQTLKAGLSLCDDSANPKGGNGRMGGSSLQASALWPTLSHSLDLSPDDKLIYVADQAGGTSGKLAGGQPRLHVIDVSQRPVKVLGETTGPGHGMDWFRTGGRDYVLHSNETASGDTCVPYPRSSAVGWGYDAFITDVTDPTKPKGVSKLTVAINDPENCVTAKAAKSAASVAYHLIDNPANAKFAMVNFGTAGLRFFDIRNPLKPTEVAYFNYGVPTHAGVGYYDANRRLIYASSANQFWVLQIEPQVRAKLGL